MGHEISSLQGGLLAVQCESSGRAAVHVTATFCRRGAWSPERCRGQPPDRVESTEMRPTLPLSSCSSRAPGCLCPQRRGPWGSARGDTTQNRCTEANLTRALLTAPPVREQIPSRGSFHPEETSVVSGFLYVSRFLLGWPWEEIQ